MMKPTIVFVLCLLLAACASALYEPAPPPHGQLSEEDATHKAASFLSGTDYGNSYVDVMGRFKDVTLLTSGHNDCGPIQKPLWAFHLVSPYAGWLYLDATTGEKQCSSLPFIR